MCSACKENGAMVGCLHKGCSQKFHYICAVESGVYTISKIWYLINLTEPKTQMSFPD